MNYEIPYTVPHQGIPLRGIQKAGDALITGESFINKKQLSFQA
jgi:hypothetical protein